MDDANRVSLRYALSWIYARDSKFSELAIQRPQSAIEDLYHTYQATNGRQLPLVTSTRKAWEELNELRSNGEIELHGSSSSVGRPVTLRTGPKIVGNAELLGEGGHYLTQYFKASALPIRWSDVWIDVAVLKQHFPSSARNRKVKLTRTERMIQQAIAELWPAGIPGHHTIAERNDVICSWVAKNLKRPNGKPTIVSGSSIDRYFRETR